MISARLRVQSVASVFHYVKLSTCLCVVDVSSCMPVWTQCVPVHSRVLLHTVCLSAYMPVYDVYLCACVCMTHDCALDSASLLMFS